MTGLLPAGLVIDHQSREVILNGVPVDLTRTEFELLTVLSSNPRRVLSPRQLLNQLWGSSFVEDESAIEVYISRLRRKLGESGSSPHYIHTIRGVGYRFDPEKPTLYSAFTLRHDGTGTLVDVAPADQPFLGWEPQEVLNTHFFISDMEQVPVDRLMATIQNMWSHGVHQHHDTAWVRDSVGNLIHVDRRRQLLGDEVGALAFMECRINPL